MLPALDGVWSFAVGSADCRWSLAESLFRTGGARATGRAGIAQTRAPATQAIRSTTIVGERVRTRSELGHPGIDGWRFPRRAGGGPGRSSSGPFHIFFNGKRSRTLGNIEHDLERPLIRDEDRSVAQVVECTKLSVALRIRGSIDPAPNCALRGSPGLRSSPWPGSESACLAASDARTFGEDP